MRPSDEELTKMIADAAPRAPRDTAERVLGRVRRERALRLRVLTGATVAVAAAAALLLIMRTRPHDPTAPAASRVEARTLAAGQSWTVGDELVQVRVDGPGEARLEHGRLFVAAGAGRLLGDGALIDSAPALLTATGVGAEVGFEVTRRAPSTVLAVHVISGGARLEPHGSRAATLLGPGDRALVATGAPALAVRAPRPASPPPAPAGARQQASTNPGTPTRAQAPAPVVPGDDEPALELDKEDVTTVIRSLLPQIKACYEKALETTPNLAGRTLVRFKVRGHDGTADVEEGEIIPSEKDDLNSPAVEQCILEVIGKARFPVTGDGVCIVDYPFVLLADSPE